MKAKLQEQVKFWQAPDLGKLDLLRATYFTHTFSRHIHNGYALGIIEHGAEIFYYRGATHTAPAGSIVVINPGEVHTGQAANGTTGWRYRMLYPETALLQRAAQEVSLNKHCPPDFPTPVIWDNALLERIRQLHIVLETSTSALERESYFVDTLARLVARHADGYHKLFPLIGKHQTIKWAKDYLETHYAQNMSLEQLASIANLSPYHFLRTFRQITGLPPHAYLTQVRVERAKGLLLQGTPIAGVAAETGFVDQSHFTRRFKRIVGVTPGQYSNNVQDTPPKAN